MAPEDRGRIARDLHDRVIQRLFAAGLALQSLAADLGPGPASDRIDGVVTDLDTTMTEIRSAIVGLRGSLGPTVGAVGVPAAVRPDTSAAPTGEKITVFLVDDHEIVRRGIAELLGSDPDIVVVGQAGTAADALARIPEVAPQVVLLDGRLPDGSGIDVCREIRSAHPDIRCLIFTSYDDNDAIFAAVMAGAAGYLLKEIKGTRLLAAIRQVAAGKSLLDPAATERLLTRLRDNSGGDARLASLTDRERDVLGLIADGLTNRQIGQRLFLAEKTVKNYVSVVLAKLGMERRTQAAVLAAELRRPIR